MLWVYKQLKYNVKHTIGTYFKQTHIAAVDPAFPLERTHQQAVENSPSSWHTICMLPLLMAGSLFIKEK